MTGVKKQMKLSADASGIVSAASSALSQVRSMINGADLTLKVKKEVVGDSEGSGSSGFFSGFSASPVKMLSVGGRFTSPTHAEIAEDGDPEYVVPVRKENEAVPLVRSLLSELSASARASLGDILSPDIPGSHPEQREGSPFAVLSAVPDIMSSAAASMMPVVQQNTSSNVSAPVNIHVEAAAADPEDVGRSIYDTAERYLLRTLESAV